ncbi:MAG: peptide chain release factor-like protein [Candidatus Peregrinibacteria bacterium]
MHHSDFVTFDHHALTITVAIEGKPPLVIHQHDPNLRISFYSKGHGGQNVNKHMSGVQLIYQIPEAYRHPSIKTSELITRSHEQRHQHQNLALALHHLATKLHDYFYVPPARFPTRPPYYTKVRRLNEKKKHGYKKELRQKPETEL